jgi:nucleoside-diphosphate-sugar epimerase
MKVLLTGASGFIGRYVLKQILNAKIDTVVLGRSRPNGYKGDYVEADLLQSADFKGLVQRIGASHLIHLAWYAEHGQYWASPLNLRWVEASVRLVEAFCAAGGKKVIATGTCAEYDWSYGFCSEDCTPLTPASLYGTSKDATRRLLGALCRDHKTQFAWGRIFLPYGSGEDSRRLIPSLLDVFQRKRPPFGVNANSYRDFLHVEDVANGFVKLLLSEAHGSYNISSGQPIQIAEVVKLMGLRFKENPSIVLDLSTVRPGEPRIIYGNSQKLQDLGWQPGHSINEIALPQDVVHD